MGAIASQITSLTIVYSTFYSDADQRKHQSSASLAFVRRIHGGTVNSLHKGPVTRKMFSFDDVIMRYQPIGLLFWNSSWWYDHFDKREHFPRYWPFVRWIRRLPVDFPHKGRWRGAGMFSLMCAWTNGWANNLDAGDFRRHRVHHDVNVMFHRELNNYVYTGSAFRITVTLPSLVVMAISWTIACRTNCAEIKLLIKRRVIPWEDILVKFISFFFNLITHIWKFRLRNVGQYPGLVVLMIKPNMISPMLHWTTQGSFSQSL